MSFFLKRQWVIIDIYKLINEINVQRNAIPRYAKLVRLFSFSASKSQQNEKETKLFIKRNSTHKQDIVTNIITTCIGYL